MLPGPGSFFQNDLLVYSGQATVSRKFEIGGKIVAGVDADVLLDLPTALWFFESDSAPGVLFGVAGHQAKNLRPCLPLLLSSRIRARKTLTDRF
jgi:hypothetical protein